MATKRVAKTSQKKRGAPKRADAKTGLIELRVPQDLLDEIDAIRERLTEERHGEHVTRSEVVRLLLREALAKRRAGG
jgi:Arc/MetJ-type ribon-helix-helix transcriptional regulator